jgi:hypothetical protein
VKLRESLKDVSAGCRGSGPVDVGRSSSAPPTTLHERTLINISRFVCSSMEPLEKRVTSARSGSRVMLTHTKIHYWPRLGQLEYTVQYSNDTHPSLCFHDARRLIAYSGHCSMLAFSGCPCTFFGFDSNRSPFPHRGRGHDRPL